MTALAPPSSPQSPAATARPRSGRLVPVLAGWAVAYGALRVFWAVTGLPSFPPLGFDLVAISGWPSVLLCGLVLGAALVPRPAPRALQYAATVALAAGGAGLCLSGALLMLDVIGLVFFGAGLYTDPLAGLSRAGAVTGGVLSGVLAVRRARSLRVAAGGCPACGRRTHTPSHRTVVKGHRGQTAVAAPAWQRAVSWLVPAAVLTRFGAQAAIGFGTVPAPYHAIGGGALMAGMALAGTLLPLATAHTWGQVWPFWVPFLAGRRIPRWLVLGPALGIGIGMTGYFGTAFGLLVQSTLHGTALGDGSLPDWFLWVAVPAYLTWGVGLLVLAAGYAARTRPPCPAPGGTIQGVRSAPAQYPTGREGRRAVPDRTSTPFTVSARPPRG